MQNETYIRLVDETVKQKITDFYPSTRGEDKKTKGLWMLQSIKSNVLYTLRSVKAKVSFVSPSPQDYANVL